MRFIVDTNVLLSALIKDSITRKIIIGLENEFYYPKISFSEIVKYKLLVMKKSGMDEKKYTKVLDCLLDNLILLPDEFIQQKLTEAKELIGKIDPDDIPFLACAIALNANIWSDDQHFEKQKKIKVFTTKEFIKKFLKSNTIKEKFS